MPTDSSTTGCPSRHLAQTASLVAMMGATAWTGAVLSTMLSSGADDLVHCRVHGEGEVATLSSSQVVNAQPSATASRGITVASLQMWEGATQARGQQGGDALGGVCPPVGLAEAIGTRRAAEVSSRHGAHAACSSESRG